VSEQFRVLTIVGSPHDKKSNTRTLVEDFLDDVEDAGLPIDRRFISLGVQTVLPCKGCWNCTVSKPCPLRDDDLKQIKSAMIDCDMLILACPVYTNQVTAQMKALFDRLFTWCHIFPLLGKYSLSACTTGNEGHKEVGSFLEKMLATYGTSSFGTIVSKRAYTPGFFPGRADAQSSHRNLAERVAETVLTGRKPPAGPWQRKMFTLMKRKMTGVHVLNFIQNGPVEGEPEPPRMMLKMVRGLLEKRHVPEEQVRKLSSLMAFELEWWKSRGWFGSRTFNQLAAVPVPADFDARARLIQD
jgi:multimeric flavodoxin WrbA